MSVPEFYGRWADLYDIIATLPGVGRWRRHAAAALNLTPGATVLEMGCGTGANLPYLRERVGSAGRVVGVDLTRPLLARAEGRGDAALVQADATDPPIQPGEPSAVVASFVLGMFRDPAAVVDTWCDIVGPGGRVALLDATTSAHPLGRVFNPAFRAFARGTAPAETTPAAVRAALSGEGDVALDRRVRAGRETLVARCHEREFESFGLGFVGLLTGTVE